MEVPQLDFLRASADRSQRLHSHFVIFMGEERTGKRQRAAHTLRAAVASRGEGVLASSQSEFLESVQPVWSASTLAVPPRDGSNALAPIRVHSGVVSSVLGSDGVLPALQILQAILPVFATELDTTAGVNEASVSTSSLDKVAWKRLCICVCVDLSSPHVVMKASQWMAAAAQLAKAAQTVDMVSESALESDRQCVELVLVGCNVKELLAQEIESQLSVRDLEVLRRRLTAVASEFGAALMYWPLTEGGRGTQRTSSIAVSSSIPGYLLWGDACTPKVCLTDHASIAIPSADIERIASEERSALPPPSRVVDLNASQPDASVGDELMLEQEFLNDLKTALGTAREENATVVGHDRVQALQVQAEMSAEKTPGSSLSVTPLPSGPGRRFSTEVGALPQKANVQASPAAETPNSSGTEVFAEYFHGLLKSRAGSGGREDVPALRRDAEQQLASMKKNTGGGS